MKRVVCRTLAPIVFAALVIGVEPCAHASQERSCANASLSGSFGCTNTGAIVAGPDAGPFGGVGRQTFDGKGNTEATARSA